MAKKVKVDLKLILAVAGALLAVLALVMGAAKAVTFGKDYAASGFDVAFGWKEKTKLGELTYSGFGFGYFLALFLPLIAGAMMFGKGKILPLIGSLLFLVSAILAFCACPLLKSSLNDKEGAIIKALYDVKDTVALGAGAVMSGIFSLLAVPVGVGKALIKS